MVYERRKTKTLNVGTEFNKNRKSFVFIYVWMRPRMRTNLKNLVIIPAPSKLATIENGENFIGSSVDALSPSPGHSR